MWNLIDATSQRILTQTYVLSRIRYTTPITYNLMAPTTRKAIESAVRGMVRDVFNASQSSSTKFFTLFTCHIPLGLKALQSKMKILQKMQKFYPEELVQFQETVGDDYW